MQHPILKNTKDFIVYAIVWLSIVIVTFIVDYVSFKSSLQLAIIESLVFNIVFALLGVAIWYAVWLSYPARIGTLNLLINHLSAACVIILIWLASSFFFIRILLSELITDKLISYLPWYIITGAVYYFIIVLVYYLIIYNYNLQEKHQNESKLLAMVKEAELNLLKSQINPHFLFNSLNSISSLTITNPAKAQEMIIKLSEFMRYSLNFPEESMSTLEKELYHIQLYLDIEKVRFGEKLNFIREVDPKCLPIPVPAMLLQPIIENSVKYGVYESTQTNRLALTTACNDEYLKISIQNDFDPDAVFRKGTGTGLINVGKRLQTAYGTQDLLKIRKESNVFIVEIKIPVHG